MTFDQSESDIRCEWGEQGVLRLAPISDAVIIVDVLSFSTCVCVACMRGAAVYPYRFRDASAAEFARTLDAELASPRGKARYSLSPASAMAVPAGARLVLPSPNGGTLSLSTGAAPTFAGCLRNPGAVARAAAACGKRVSVIAAGERWKSDGSLRPAIEDLIGAGAIIRCLRGARSPEAETAVAAFIRFEGDLVAALRQCSSGKELIEMGYECDVLLSAALDADPCAPRLADGAYRT